MTHTDQTAPNTPLKLATTFRTNPNPNPPDQMAAFYVNREMVDRNRDWSDPVRIRFETEPDGPISLWIKFVEPNPDAPKRIYEHLHESFKTDLLRGCARCGGEHRDMVWQPLTDPLEDTDGSLWTHWQLCPENGQPILMRSTSEPS